jgi:hypothetical protein
MSGTRKLDKFELERPTSQGSGTRKLEKYEPPRGKMISITTPVAEIPLETLAAARPSTPSYTPEAIAEQTARDSTARSADREPAVEILRTQLARKFTTLADEVTDSFADFQIGAGAWQPELTAPEGMSTGGGKQVVQHLRLRPKRQGHQVLVGGLVNSVTASAELRDYEYMVALQHARRGAESTLEITYDEWEQFLRKAEVVLRAQDIASTRVSPPRDLRMFASHGPSLPWRTIALVALGIIAPLALVVAWRVVVVLLR